jgi:hypothetical protein
MGTKRKESARVNNRRQTTFLIFIPFLAGVCSIMGERTVYAASRSGVPETIRELEEAESRLKGGVYQVPLIQKSDSAPQESSSAVKQGDQRRKSKQGENAPLGIDISAKQSPVTAEDEKNSGALSDVAARVAQIQARTNDVRARILTLQEEMASRLEDVAYAKVTLVVVGPPVATTALASSPEQENAARKWPLAVHELSAALDEVPLTERHHPRRLERDAQFPLYEGPLPMGEYALKIRVVVGLLGSGWPSQVGQGRWLLEDTLKLKHAPSRGSKGIDATVYLEPSLGNAKPTMRLQVREAR